LHIIPVSVTFTERIIVLRIGPKRRSSPSGMPEMHREKADSSLPEHAIRSRSAVPFVLTTQTDPKNMKSIKGLLLGCLLLLGATLTAQEHPLWTRYPAISPDGTQIAFCYKGDIFVVGSAGGRAMQLTTHAAYDGHPIWSPDSRTIAFVSARDKGMDLFTVPATGGTPTRLTNFSGGSATPECFTPDGKNILFRSKIMPDRSYGQYPFDSQVYSVPAEGGRPTRFLTFEACNISFDKAGKRMVYHDKKGYEDEWRKHHTSSICRDIWIHDLTTGSFTNLTDKQVEDRYPVLASDDETIYFVSERFGSANVCRMSLGDPKRVEQLTRFERHPVRFLTRSDDDRLCFFYDGEIYTMKPGESPSKVDITIVADNQEPDVEEWIRSGGAQEIAVSPDGKEFAFVLRGDVFVADAEFGTTRRITNTAARERNVNFSPDGRQIVYASERDGQWQLFLARIADKEDPSFAYARTIEEEQLTEGDKARFQPAFSPDGKEIAFLEERTTVKIMTLANKKTRVVLPGTYNYSYTDGDQAFEWSPDGQWILAEFFEEGGWQHPDIALVKADGKGEIHNLTNSGYSDGNARWALGGKAIIWATDREGMRSHGSWGAQYDVYALFLDPEAYADFRKTKEERTLAEKLKTEKEKKREQKDSVKAADKLPELTIDFDGLEERMVRLTIHSSQLSDAVLTHDGRKLYYLAAFEGGYDLWVRDFEDNSTRLFSKLGRGGRLELSKDGSKLYLLSGGQIRTIDPNSGQTKSLNYTARFSWKPAAERRSLFDHVWQQVCDKFYDPEFKGVDWNYYKKAYERFLPHINNDFDFAEVLGEMLGELNASHTGARYYGSYYRPITSFLGAFYDESHTGDGLRISEVLVGGPLDMPGSRIEAGTIIRKIDNRPIEAGKDYFELLNGKAGQRTLLTLYNPKSKKEWEEYVKPVSLSRQNDLLYKRWVKRRQELTDSLSGNRIGYIHVAAMNSASFRKAYSEILGKYRNREAIIVDTRYNGGGWLHEDLVHLLSGKQFATFVPRGQFIGIDPFAQWTKPSAVLVSQGNYSNAHGFPWVYKELKLGKLVGMPVPGTMTAVWWETMMNGIVFGIPQVGMKDNQGRILENMQLEPDILVNNDPAHALEGRDLQLEAAVKSLLQELE